MLGHMVTLFSHLRNYQTDFHGGCPIYIPTGLCIRVDFSISLSTLVIICLFDYSHPIGYEASQVVLVIKNACQGRRCKKLGFDP